MLENRVFGRPEGEDVWHNRTAVSELLNQLAGMQFLAEAPAAVIPQSSDIEHFTDGLIEGECAVQSALYTLLSQEASQNRNASFQIFLPFGENLSPMFLRLWREGLRFDVDQLFCFPSVVDNDCSQSVQALMQIIPLCLTARDSYHPYYFYERPGFLGVNPLNYYMITPHHLILLSQDLSTALFQSSERLVKHFSNYFVNLMENCEPLISCAMNLSDILKISNSMVNPKGAMYLMPQPCFGRYYTPELISKYFRSDISTLEEMYDAVVKHFSMVQSVDNNFCTVFSEKGLEYFIQTGHLTELPQEYVPAIDIEDRILFLTLLKDDIAADRVTGRIARPSALRIPDYLTLYIDTNGNTWFDTTSDFIHGAYYCDIHIFEKSICRAFQDFFQSLAGSRLVYSKEDTLQMLDAGIRKLSSKKLPR